MSIRALVAEGKELVEVKSIPLARWASRGGRYWLELYKDGKGFRFRADNGGGNLGMTNMSEKQARAEMAKRISDLKKYDNITLKASK